LETLPRLSIEDLHAFHHQQYGPRQMIFVIVGPVNAQNAVKMIERHLGDWQNGQQPEVAALPEVEAPNDLRQISHTVPGKTQTDVILGTLGPSRFAADYQAANLANSILGQFGMMGRIGDVVREREGMAYYAYSRMEGGIGPGAWSVAAGVNPANVDRAIELCRGELQLMTSELVSVEDLEDNQSYFTGRLPLQLESSEGVAGTLLTMETYDLGLDYLLHYPEMIYAVTREDVLAAAQRYLHPDRLVISVAGP
jgi:zinc protease